MIPKILKHKLKWYGIFGGIIFYISPIYSQVLYSLEALQAEALRNSRTLKILEKEQKWAAINNSKGFAGLLPSVSLTGGYGIASQNANLTFNTGSTVTRNGAGSSNANMSLLINQNIFNGFKSQAILNRLSLQEQSIGYIKKQQEKFILSEVALAYWQMVRDIEWIKQLDSLNTYYLTRLDLIKALMNVGKATQQEVYQAEIDLANNNALKINKIWSLNLAKNQINLLLDKPEWFEFQLTDTQLPANLPLPDTSELSLRSNHYQLNALYLQWLSAESEVKEYKADLYPNIFASGNINWINNTSEVGILLKNQTLGGGVSLNISYQLYNGNNQRNLIAMAKIKADIARLRYEDLLKSLKSEINRYVIQHHYSESVHKLLSQSLLQSKLQLQLTFESFKAGVVSQFELVQAQSNVENAYIVLLENKFKHVESIIAINRLCAKQ